uniref:Glycosyltransferase RgtA/B/C/D-like domain-containing protein n=1 Tax=Solibacter usitatus (strain Ellin6076) TaxID=234267 RepID=Q02CC3_SOLUE
MKRTLGFQVRFWLGFAFLAVSSAILAYYRIFTGFAEWDDEGTLMMTVRQFLSGGTLYETVRSGYGPVYYFFNWLIRTVTFTGVSHDVTRFTSMTIWTACAMACAWIVWRLGRSLTAALLTHLVAFRALGLFGNEPGHPQELCIILLIALAASGLAAGSGRLRHAAAALAGALPAALLLVKINIGIFATLAAALAVLYHAPQLPLVRIARYLAGAASLVLPFLLMRAHLNDPLEIAYCVAVTAGMAALLTGVVKPVPVLSLADCAIAVSAFALTAAAVLGVLLIQGVAPFTILTSLVLQHVQLSVKQGNWYMSMGLDPAWIAWALLAPVLALFLVRRRERQLPPLAIMAFSILAFVVAALGTNRVVGAVTPFCWLVAYRPGASYARTLLAALATLQTLYAYPLAGSQAPFITVLLLVVAGVCLADSLADLPASLREGTLARTTGIAVVLLALLAYPAQAWRARNFYLSHAPLNLPGASRIRIAPHEAANFQWLVRQLKQHCDTFVGYPGIPSLYFWTGKPMPGPLHTPPGPLNADAWTLLLTPAQQQPIVDEFAQHPNACVVYHPSGVLFWNRNGNDESALPLVSYIQHNFKTVGSIGDYQFQVRNQRAFTDALR